VSGLVHHLDCAVYLTLSNLLINFRIAELEIEHLLNLQEAIKSLQD
jgi:hypothetical protein